MKKLLFILLLFPAFLAAQNPWNVQEWNFREYRGTTYKDSAKITVLSETADTTTWMSTRDSTGSHGFYSSLYTVGTTDATALVHVQYGILNPTSGAYQPMKYAGYSVLIDSLYDIGGAAGVLVKKNPTGTRLFYRAIDMPGATVCRFIVTWGVVTESGTAYARGRLTGPTL
jgi:hypothetical protein